MNITMKYLLSTFFFSSTTLYGAVHLSILSNFMGPEVISTKSAELKSPTIAGDNDGSQQVERTFQKQLIQWSSTNSSIVHPTTGKVPPRKALVISSAPRTVKHVVALWSELECFTSDVDYVILSGPLWSETILQEIVSMAKASIPQFASDIAITSQVFVNDRYDVGLWCDALEWMDRSGDLATIHQIELLNDSVFALRDYSGVLSALEEQNASMTSLSYSMNRPEGHGPDMYWVESVWRGFDRPGIQTFKDYSCRPATDPMFCSKNWWGKKGCIVENFERNMILQFPRDKVVGLFPSDVPPEMLTRKHSFPNWVRHPPYWQMLVEDENFPVSKVNWPDMIGSIDDDRLQVCTKHLDRSTLDGFDFSAAIKAF